jgi:hypothetical protein
MGVGDHCYVPAALPLEVGLATPCTGGWVGGRAGLDGADNLAPIGIRSRTVQPVVSHYTDCSLPASK